MTWVGGLNLGSYGRVMKTTFLFQEAILTTRFENRRKDST